ncbi:MAG: phosphoribosylaminoimidazolesuccinocarboxamide synthase [Candidatus Taylorbacteria bacterium]
MPHIPKSILDASPDIPGLTLRFCGKDSNQYNIPGYPGLLLSVRSNRCSVFKRVLPILIPRKGEVLNALSHFFTKSVIGPYCETDFIAAGEDIDSYLPIVAQGNPDLQRRATVIKRLQRPRFQHIGRFHLTGRGWREYSVSGQIDDHVLIQRFTNGSRLPFPVYTPTAKAMDESDEPISAECMSDFYGSSLERETLQLGHLVKEYVYKRGLILADYKIEFSSDNANNKYVLVDEKFTTDTCRYWDKLMWENVQHTGQLPSTMGNQDLYDWGVAMGIDILDPANSHHQTLVDNMKVPDDVVEATTQSLLAAFYRLTDTQLENYQSGVLKIKAHPSD